jgi:hypothetical protein
LEGLNFPARFVQCFLSTFFALITAFLATTPLH